MDSTSNPTENQKNRTLEVDLKTEFPREFFERATKSEVSAASVRPSLSYWQDAFHRFKKNKQSLFAFVLAMGLAGFSFLGPFLWTKDPAQQDISNPALAPNLGQSAIVVADNPDFSPSFAKVDLKKLPLKTAKDLGAVTGLRVVGVPNTQRVELHWEFLPGASSILIYRSEIEPVGEGLGIPVGEITDPTQTSYEDNQTLEARDYYYTVVAIDGHGEESSQVAQLKVPILSALPLSSAKDRGLSLAVGDRVELKASPLGTDNLGRDILARLMAGGRISLTIGLMASILSVVLGIFLGGISGFFGGTVDSLLMRFTDLITGLPFLLFMILLKVVLNVGPGESGVTALLISLVVLSWTGTARLVRGQILQLRGSEFVQAARMMGAKPGYLILRHMLPNLIGVILVTLTFQVPSAIFTEAFLSFIGLGVAAPATSWGSLCNDGLSSLLTRPYEFFAPALVISITVLSFNLLGDGLRDALDPKLRSNE